MNDISADNIEKPNSCMGVRHVQSVLLFFAMTLTFAMRVNMSMAIVAMTDSAGTNSFDWNIQTQSIILSSFFWGYVVLQIPGGMLTGRYGGKILLTICVGVNALTSLLIPIGAEYGGWQLVCACRVLQGLTQGFLFPTVHHLISKWIPLEEKSRLGTIIYAGAQLGTAVQLLISGFIAAAWGWQAIFYIDGIVGIVWFVSYVILGADSPQSSKMISKVERNYIQNSLGHIGGDVKKYTTPWRSIWSSIPFITLIITHCSQNWGFWTLMTEIPSYFSQVLGVDIKTNGAVSALPYLVMYLLSFPLGFMSDFLVKKKWLSITVVRKISNSIGFWGPGVALIGLSYSPVGNVGIAVLLLCLTVGLNAGHYTGYLLVHIDMAPNFAGTLMGITNCAANIISIIAPIAAGQILEDETDPSEWMKVFYLSSIIYLVGNLIFIIFASSKRQPWNEPEDKCSSPGAPEENNKSEEKCV